MRFITAGWFYSGFSTITHQFKVPKEYLSQWKCALDMALRTCILLCLIFRVRRVQCSCALCTLLNIHLGFFACDFECQIFHIKSSKATLQIVNSQIPYQRKLKKNSTKNKNKVLENKGNFANSNLYTVFKLQSTIEILNRSR